MVTFRAPVYTGFWFISSPGLFKSPVCLGIPALGTSLVGGREGVHLFFYDHSLLFFLFSRDRFVILVFYFSLEPTVSTHQLSVFGLHQRATFRTEHLIQRSIRGGLIYIFLTQSSPDISIGEQFHCLLAVDIEGLEHVVQ